MSGTVLAAVFAAKEVLNLVTLFESGQMSQKEFDYGLQRVGLDVESALEAWEKAKEERK
jgi:hypothetical protein